MSKDELGRATWMFLHILIVQVILLSLLLFLFCWFSSSCFFYISFFGFIFLQSFQLLQLDYFVLNIQKIQQGNKMIVKNIIFHKAKRSVLALNFMEIYQWPTICFFFFILLVIQIWTLEENIFRHVAKEIKVHVHCDIFVFVNDVDSKV